MQYIAGGRGDVVEFPKTPCSGMMRLKGKLRHQIIIGHRTGDESIHPVSDIQTSSVLASLSQSGSLCRFKIRECLDSGLSPFGSQWKQCNKVT